MAEMSWKLSLRCAGPAIVTGALLGVLWMTATCGYFGQEMKKVFVGWVCVMFLAATVGGIIWGATGNGGGKRLMAGMGMLMGMCAVMLGVVNEMGGFVRAGECASVGLVLVAWVGLWTGAAWALRRLSGSVAMGVGMVGAMLLFAGPVTGMPLVRAMSGGMQEGVVMVIGYGTPMLGVLDGMKRSVQFGGGGVTGWTELPMMYHLTNLGQDVAAPTPRWWVSGGIYTVAGLAAWGAGWVRRR